VTLALDAQGGSLKVTESPKLIVSHDLGEFFRDELSSARDHLGVDVSDHVEHYLVTLLCEYARHGAAPAPGEEPLALIYKRALEATIAQRIQLLKTLGDQALYVSGFFTEFIERSLVDVDYYVSMGGSAYSSVSDIVGSQPNGDSFAELYQQLAIKFTELVDLLNEIAERSRSEAEDCRGLLRLYDRWARTGSERIRKLLVERGVVPPDAVPTEYEQ
jgi:hypothetical protein